MYTVGDHSQQNTDNQIFTIVAVKLPKSSLWQAKKSPEK